MKKPLPFSVFKRARQPSYLVAFKNLQTGAYMPPISTRQTDEAEAIKTKVRGEIHLFPFSILLRKLTEMLNFSAKSAWEYPQGLFLSQGSHHGIYFRVDTKKLFDLIKAGKFKPYTSEYAIDELNLTTREDKRTEMKALIGEYHIELLPTNDEIKRLAGPLHCGGGG
jgi:hypothetical protein